VCVIIIQAKSTKEYTLFQLDLSVVSIAVHSDLMKANSNAMYSFVLFSRDDCRA